MGPGRASQGVTAERVLPLNRAAIPSNAGERRSSGSSEAAIPGRIAACAKQAARRMRREKCARHRER